MKFINCERKDNFKPGITFKTWIFFYLVEAVAVIDEDDVEITNNSSDDENVAMETNDLEIDHDFHVSPQPVLPSLETQDPELYNKEGDIPSAFR